MIQVSLMKKVQVSISILDSETKVAVPERTVLFSFIYGIGRDGLTPFECSLEGCSTGEQVETEVQPSLFSEYFGGLFPTIRSLIDGHILPPNVLIRIDVNGVEDVDNREVVAALAGAAGGCGSGGSCDCGCS